MRKTINSDQNIKLQDLLPHNEKTVNASVYPDMILNDLCVLIETQPKNMPKQAQEGEVNLT